MERKTFLIQVSSGDFSVRNGDTMSNFSNLIPYRLPLDRNKSYEVALYDVQFTFAQNATGSITQPFWGVAVGSNLVANTISNSNTSNFIYTMSPNQIINNTYPATVPFTPSLSATKATYVKTWGNRKWFPLALNYLDRINVTLHYMIPLNLLTDDGDYYPLLPVVPNAFTICTFAIREIV